MERGEPQQCVVVIIDPLWGRTRVIHSYLVMQSSGAELHIRDTAKKPERTRMEFPCLNGIAIKT